MISFFCLPPPPLNQLPVPASPCAAGPVPTYLPTYLKEAEEEEEEEEDESVHLHAPQLENTVSGHVLTKAPCPNHNLAANLFPEKSTQRSGERTSPPRRQQQQQLSNILRCVQVDARFNEAALQMRLR